MKPSKGIKPTSYYGQTQQSLALLRLLAHSRHSVEAGRYKPLKKAFGDLAAKAKDLPCI